MIGKNRNYWRGSEADLCKTISGRAWMADRNSIFFRMVPDRRKQQSGFGRFFENCRFVVLPVPVLRKGKLNTGAEYKPDAEQLMEYVKHGQCIFGGCFSKELKNRILCRGGESYDLMQLERIVRENVAATAEGAVAEAVQNSPVTLRGEFVYSDRVWPMRKCNSSVPEKLGMYDRGV